ARRLERELHRERRPLAGERLDPDPPAVDRDQPARDREAEPRPAVPGTVGAGSVERLEDPLLLRGRDAGPAIDDADEQSPADGAGADRHGMTAGVARGVVEHVRE